MKLRFAPSPTGYIHVGNCRTLLVNWLFARHYEGEFILRLDDTDQARSEKKYEDALLEDIRWLGLNFDDYKRQSDHLERYREIAETLKKEGRLYPCYETSEELEFKRRRQVTRGLPPLYDREALKISEVQKQTFEREGRLPHWRFLLTDEDVKWDDLIRGPLHFEGKNLSDPILLREDGMPVYTFASVIDDMDMGITHIIRGEDHIANTAIQIQLWRALGVPDGSIQFAHPSLLSSAEGEEFSKRLGSGSIRDLKAAGILPMTLTSMLAKIGTSDSIQPYMDLEPLIKTFDIKKFSRATPKFSIEELSHLNQKIVHQLSFEKAKEYSGLSMIDPDFWEAVRPNLSTLAELKEWWSICREENVSTFVNAADEDFITEALESLPPAPWTETSTENWIESLKKTGRKGKELFRPLRQALTGQDHGPEFKKLLELMGPELSKKRLKKSLETI